MGFSDYVKYLSSKKSTVERFLEFAKNISFYNYGEMIWLKQKQVFRKQSKIGNNANVKFVLLSMLKNLSGTSKMQQGVFGSEKSGQLAKKG